MAIEYVEIQVASGAVQEVLPKNPQTETALEVGRKSSIVDVINKLAEYDYRLVTVVPVAPGGAGGEFFTIFMERTI